MSFATSVLFNSTHQWNGTCFCNTRMISVACLYSVCFPFIFHFFSFQISRPPNSFLLMRLLLSFIYPFSIINSSIFDVWFLFPFSSVVVTKIVLSFFLYIVYTFSSRLSYAHFSLFLPPGCFPSPLYPHILRRNGHPFLLAFVTHSCVLLWHFTVDVPSHPASRHLTTELSLQLDFANDDLSDPCVNDTKKIWSVVNHFLLQRRYFSLLYELGCGNVWDSAWTWTKICQLYLFLLVERLLFSMYIVDLNEKVPDELGRLWP